MIQPWAVTHVGLFRPAVSVNCHKPSSNQFPCFRLDASHWISLKQTCTPFTAAVQSEVAAAEAKWKKWGIIFVLLFYLFSWAETTRTKRVHTKSYTLSLMVLVFLPPFPFCCCCWNIPKSFILSFTGSNVFTASSPRRLESFLKTVSSIFPKCSKATWVKTQWAGSSTVVPRTLMHTAPGLCTQNRNPFPFSCLVRRIC